jgi:methionyl-tRNA formyltransferase
VAVRFREEDLRLVRAKDEAAPAQQIETPGTIVDAEAGLIACAPGTALRLLEVQPPGGRVMAWRDYAHGRRVRSGERLFGAEDAPC